MKTFFQKYKHSLVLLYGLLYMPWFLWLESRASLPYHVIHMGIDDRIPFMEIFFVPYLIWFIYVPAVFIYLFFKNKGEFYRYCIFLFTGMTLFLVISTVYPNGHLLRPASFERNNIFIYAVQFLYRADTATNIFPSLHVYNSIAAHMAVAYNKRLGSSFFIRNISRLLMITIILATMCLKQHSAADVISGILLGVLMDQMVYRTDFALLRQKAQQRRKKTKKGVVI